MRRAAKVDANHASVVAALRAIGCMVQDLSGVGDGCPDLLVGIRGTPRGKILVLMEIKDGDKAPSKQRLTKDQLQFYAQWDGFPVDTVRSVEQAVAIVNAYRVCG